REVMRATEALGPRTRMTSMVPLMMPSPRCFFQPGAKTLKASSGLTPAAEPMLMVTSRALLSTRVIFPTGSSHSALPVRDVQEQGVRIGADANDRFGLFGEGFLGFFQFCG